jgi:hypothetical protein
MPAETRTKFHIFWMTFYEALLFSQGLLWQGIPQQGARITTVPEPLNCGYY